MTIFTRLDPRTKVLTPFGFTPVKDIKDGDSIFNPNGELYQVISTKSVKVYDVAVTCIEGPFFSIGYPGKLSTVNIPIAPVVEWKNITRRYKLWYNTLGGTTKVKAFDRTQRDDALKVAMDAYNDLSSSEEKVHDTRIPGIIQMRPADRRPLRLCRAILPFNDITPPTRSTYVQGLVVSERLSNAVSKLSKMDDFETIDIDLKTKVDPISCVICPYNHRLFFLAGVIDGCGDKCPDGYILPKLENIELVRQVASITGFILCLHQKGYLLKGETITYIPTVIMVLRDVELRKVESLSSLKFKVTKRKHQSQFIEVEIEGCPHIVIDDGIILPSLYGQPGINES